jgi:hypothetical protein
MVCVKIAIFRHWGLILGTVQVSFDGLGGDSFFSPSGADLGHFAGGF